MWLPTVSIGNMIGVVDLRGQLCGMETHERRELSDLGPDGPLEWLAVHHMAGAERDFSALEIARYHVHTLGWPGIGYHFLVHVSGRVDYVGDIFTIRHNVARQNHQGIGLCRPGTSLGGPRTRLSLEPRGSFWPISSLLWGGLCRLGGTARWPLPSCGTSCPGDTWQIRRSQVTAS